MEPQVSLSAADKPHEKAAGAEMYGKDESDRETCAALCSLMAASGNPESRLCSSPTESDQAYSESRQMCQKTCPKQLQLPMFLSKTYHMIDKCDDEIACWSELGDNFVVKNVDKFASSVLPLYFKHSNFSSFARQLNFYGFRKLRSESILTHEVDPQTASHVRFYHEKFQRDQPELLHEIKRATKTDQMSKDDVDSLKQEVSALKHALALTTTEYDRRLAELSYDCNRRISATNAELDKVLTMVKQLVPSQTAIVNGANIAAANSTNITAAANSILSSTETTPSQRSQVGLLHSLSQVAAAHCLPSSTSFDADLDNSKRPAQETRETSNKQPRLSDDSPEL